MSTPTWPLAPATLLMPLKSFSDSTKPKDSTEHDSTFPTTKKCSEMFKADLTLHAPMTSASPTISTEIPSEPNSTSSAPIHGLLAAKKSETIIKWATRHSASSQPSNKKASRSSCTQETSMPSSLTLKPKNTLSKLAGNKLPQKRIWWMLVDRWWDGKLSTMDWLMWLSTELGIWSHQTSHMLLMKCSRVSLERARSKSRYLLCDKDDMNEFDSKWKKNESIKLK